MVGHPVMGGRLLGGIVGIKDIWPIGHPILITGLGIVVILGNHIAPNVGHISTCLSLVRILHIMLLTFMVARTQHKFSGVIL